MQETLNKPVRQTARLIEDLEQLRERFGRSIERTAQDCWIRETLLRAWEAGKVEMPHWAISTLADYFGVGYATVQAAAKVTQARADAFQTLDLETTGRN